MPDTEILSVIHAQACHWWFNNAGGE